MYIVDDDCSIRARDEVLLVFSRDEEQRALLICLKMISFVYTYMGREFDEASSANASIAIHNEAFCGKVKKKEK